MKTVLLNELTTQQQSIISRLPDHLIQKLKELSFEEQMECIYIRESRHSCNSPLTDSVKFSYGFSRYISLIDCNSYADYEAFSELLVFDGMAIGIRADDGRTISYMTPVSKTYTKTQTYMDSHDHRLYDETFSETIYSELVLYTLHEKIQ